LAQGEPLEIKGVTVRWTASTIDGEGGGSMHERFERLGHERIGVMGEPGLDGQRIVRPNSSRPILGCWCGWWIEAPRRDWRPAKWKTIIHPLPFIPR